jgi:putative ATPase
MVEGGEDPKFIARRLVILAAEDIGLANPNALLLANACFQAVENVGWPESRIILSECTLYLASSPKGNAAYMAINKAQQLVQQTGNLSVPLPLRNAPSALMKELGYGQAYNYSHDHPGNFYDQEFLPSEIAGTNFIHPGSSAKEQEIADQIKKWWQDKYKF